MKNLLLLQKTDIKEIKKSMSVCECRIKDNTAKNYNSTNKQEAGKIELYKEVINLLKVHDTIIVNNIFSIKTKEQLTIYQTI